jgi:hypothetical protein
MKDLDLANLFSALRQGVLEAPRRV